MRRMASPDTDPSWNEKKKFWDKLKQEQQQKQQEKQRQSAQHPQTFTSH